MNLICPAGSIKSKGAVRPVKQNLNFGASRCYSTSNFKKLFAGHLAPKQLSHDVAYKFQRFNVSTRRIVAS